jgi:hypothetical protein
MPPATTEIFNFNGMVAVTPPVESPSRHGGIILGSMTDFSGTNCTVQTDNGLPFYRASADGTTLFSLYPDPTFFIANGHHSNLIPSARRSLVPPVPRSPATCGSTSTSSCSTPAWRASSRSTWRRRARRRATTSTATAR